MAFDDFIVTLNLLTNSLIKLLDVFSSLWVSQIVTLLTKGDVGSAICWQLLIKVGGGVSQLLKITEKWRGGFKTSQISLTYFVKSPLSILQFILFFHKYIKEIHLRQTWSFVRRKTPDSHQFSTSLELRHFVSSLYYLIMQFYRNSSWMRFGDWHFIYKVPIMKHCHIEDGNDGSTKFIKDRTLKKSQLVCF